MYDYDSDEIEVLGREEFLTRLWESIFVGYRSLSGLRKQGRRWSDLLQAGLDCSEELADELVRTEIVLQADRDLEHASDPGWLLAGMDRVLADMGLYIAEMDGLPPDQRRELLARHAGLRQFIRGTVLGPEPGDGRPAAAD